MELLNFTKMVVGHTVGLQKDGRSLLIIVAKGTFNFPSDGREPELAESQLPLVDADIFSGEPGFSAPICEADYAPRKSRCDVLLNGSAYSPGGRPIQKVSVALRVGPMAKTFNVVGRRLWTRGMTSMTPSEPEFFVRLPISYDYAFGGIDSTVPDKPRHFPTNHAGKGFSHHMNLDKVVGLPISNTEEIDNPIANPRGSYRPMALGPIGRSWEPRCKLTGTYDQNWLDNVCPLLPDDFDEEYYQAAPRDQQIPYLLGGEEVSLLNLTPEGQTHFKIPRVEIPVTIIPVDGEEIEGVPASTVCDTLLLEPDNRQFTLVWRVCWPLRQDLFEIAAALVGKPPRAYERAAETGKTYYRSLGEFADTREAVTE